MKKFLSKIAVLAGTLFSLNATAQIQNSNLLLQYSNEFWISTNVTRNIYGTTNYSPTAGTLANPLDGSTEATFDTNMNNLPANCVVHILAGTYETLGNHTWQLQTGQKILGSGRDNTILQIPVGLTGVGLTAIYSQWNLTNAEIADLTIDCNWQPGSGNTSGGISMGGTGSIVRRVRVIHCGDTAGLNSEAFGIGVGSAHMTGTSQGNIIEDCEVSQYSGGPNITAIGFNGSLTCSASAIIRNNTVILPADSSLEAFGINGAWVSSAVVEGNYVYGALNGIYSDTGGWTNLFIMNNTLRNCFNGVTISPVNNPLRNITIAFNKIELVASNNYNAVAFNFWGSGAASLTNIFIFGNTVDFYNSGSSPGWLIAAASVTGLVFENNFVDPILATNQWGTTAQIYWGTVNNLTIDNNYDLNGNYLYDLNMPVLGGVPVTRFGLSLVNNANASSALTNLGLPSNPTAVVTNNAASVTLSGTFSGNGSSLTGLNWSHITGAPTFAQYSDPAPTFTNGMNIGLNTAYQIGGNNVLWSSNSPGIGDNLVVGRETPGVVPNGLGDLIVGSFAMPSSTNASSSTIVGISAGRNLLSSTFNTIVGSTAAYSLQHGDDNTFVGFQTGFGGAGMTNSYQNTLIGDSAFYRASSGTNNVALGYFAGSWLFSGNNNAFIAHTGTSAETNSNGTIYIGDNGVHTKTYVAGTVYCGDSLVATNGFQCLTNYAPATWTPVPGSVILRASNNWMYAITARSTNAAFKISP